MKRIIKNSDQNILDVAIQHNGTLENIADLLINNDCSITDVAIVGVDIASADAANNKIVESLNKPCNIPASSDNEPVPEGIDFWRVGIDFKIK